MDDTRRVALIEQRTRLVSVDPSPPRGWCVSSTATTWLGGPSLDENGAVITYEESNT